MCGRHLNDSGRCPVCDFDELGEQNEEDEDVGDETEEL